MEALRQEIIAAQNARIDLLKWKLLIIAALSATGLGLSKDTPSTANLSLVLCCIPIVCTYVDLLCQHLTLRMLAIGEFIQRQKLPEATDPVRRDIVLYEQFVRRDSVRHAFDLESYALAWSSGLLDIAVVAYGLITHRYGAPPHTMIRWLPYVASGVVGLLLTLLMSKLHRRRKELLRFLPSEAEYTANVKGDMQCI